MRNLVLAITASFVLFGCGSSGSGGSPAPQGASTVISCFWGSTCDQYSGTVDPTFASNIQTTCGMHGVAFSASACPTASQVVGHCDFGTSSGVNSSYYYYSPTYDAASAQADCVGNVIGVAWVP
jgi:hypothetical protein